MERLEQILKEYKKYNKGGLTHAKNEILDLFSVSNRFPTDKEVWEEAQKVEKFRPFDDDIKQAESAGRYYGFKKGVEWLKSKLNDC